MCEEKTKLDWSATNCSKYLEWFAKSLPSTTLEDVLNQDMKKELGQRKQLWMTKSYEPEPDSEKLHVAWGFVLIMVCAVLEKDMESFPFLATISEQKLSHLFNCTAKEIQLWLRGEISDQDLQKNPHGFLRPAEGKYVYEFLEDSAPREEFAKKTFFLAVKSLDLRAIQRIAQQYPTQIEQWMSEMSATEKSS